MYTTYIHNLKMTCSYHILLDNSHGYIFYIENSAVQHTEIYIHKVIICAFQHFLCGDYLRAVTTKAAVFNSYVTYITLNIHIHTNYIHAYTL